MSRRDFVRASYTGSGTKGQSAARLARYIEYRQRDTERDREQEPAREQERDPERESQQEQSREQSYERAQTYGDREEFLEAAKERAEAGRRSSYVHVVVSPERGQEYEDRDFERLVESWTKDRNGNELAHYAAVHRDTEHPHVHIVVARDKFQKAEYANLKEQSRDRMGERERMMAPEREPEMERILQMEQSRDRMREREQERYRDQERPPQERAPEREQQPEREEPGRGRERQRERDLGRDRDDGREMER